MWATQAEDVTNASSSSSSMVACRRWENICSCAIKNMVLQSKILQSHRSHIVKCLREGKSKLFKQIGLKSKKKWQTKRKWLTGSWNVKIVNIHHPSADGVQSSMLMSSLSVNRRRIEMNWHFVFASTCLNSSSQHVGSGHDALAIRFRENVDVLLWQRCDVLRASGKL